VQQCDARIIKMCYRALKWGVLENTGSVTRAKGVNRVKSRGKVSRLRMIAFY